MGTHVRTQLLENFEQLFRVLVVHLHVLTPCASIDAFIDLTQGPHTFDVRFFHSFLCICWGSAPHPCPCTAPHYRARA